METTSNWKPAPACWFTSSSLTEGLGREIWASHAPTAWPSLHASPQIAKEVMKTHDLNFAQRPHLLVTRIVTYDSTDIAFAPYGDYWRQLRKICVIELLSAKRVRSFQLIRKEEVSNLIRFIDSCSRFSIDLREKISSFTFAVISKAALGKEFKEQDSLESVLEEGTKLASGFCLADVYPSVKWIHLISGMRHKLEKLHDRIDGILQIIVDESTEREWKKEQASLKQKKTSLMCF